MNKEIDMKHSIGVHENGDPYLFKSSNGQAIPSDEPTILFRGRDKLAVPMLQHYFQLCVDAGVTPYQLDSINEMIGRFIRFSQTSPTMKMPGSTSGR